MLSIYTQESDRILSSAIHTEGEVLPACQLGAIWYDLYKPTRKEDNYVEQCLSVSFPTRAEMDEIEPSARLYNGKDAEFMTVTALSELDSGEPAKTPITFVLKGGSLVTVRYSEPMPFTFFAQRIQKPGGPACTSGEMAMLGILEAMINRMADILERVGGALDRFSHKAFRSKVRNVTQGCPSVHPSNSLQASRNRTPALIARRLDPLTSLQVRSIVAMIKSKRSCVDVAQQPAAATSALASAKDTFIRDHIDHCLVGAAGSDQRDQLSELKAITKFL
ncbi:MAG: metal-sensing transcriptional repressor [Phyllobacterium sp.]|uniref:metal-sensing transcriptional repressor n=1 Tax=Phyllobacterium sp. TaxID=1871046 RepID=UPI0030F1E829